MKRSKHSLSHYRLLTGDMGYLMPCGLIEVLPGDSIQQASSMLMRFSPMLTPPMHRVHMRIHHWFVPHRLVWDDWEDFITGGPDGEDDSAVPTRSITNGAAVGSLYDYLGLPTLSGGVELELSTLPLRGYQLIWNEFYRDQDLQTPAAISKSSGLDATTSATLQRCSWRKDYFTSSRPWPQKGPEVTMPLGLEAPIQRNGEPMWVTSGAANRTLKLVNGQITVQLDANSTESGNLMLGRTDDDEATGLTANLAQATAASINDLREAFALQRYAEARARYGSRYTEYLRYLGVRSSDARLQRPEYLGGGRQLVQFSEVLQTGVTSDGEAEGVGNMYGHGIGTLRSNRYRRFFEEHGYIFSLISVLPDTMYLQGIPRTWNRRTKEDFFQKELQHIGQQEVLNKELYAAHSSPNGVFGYQDRYDEYRRVESGVSGEFKTTLDDWHFARIFSSQPALNGDFVTATPAKRPFADQTSNVLWMMVNHSIQARRLLSRTGWSGSF